VAGEDELNGLMRIIEWLRLPQCKSIENLDDPATTLLHRQIIREKKFLRRLYVDFYRQLKSGIKEPESKILVELGSGGGFIKEVIPNAITSDVLELPNVDMVFSAEKMPFEGASVDGFLMFDVLHHLAEPRAFFTEACRCLKNGGKIVMIEPANTLWSRFIFRNFHHESFEPDSGWELERGGPVSQGNGALPWIIFCRDRKLFEREFPQLKIESIRCHTPLRYLLSGGLTLRQLVPSFTYPAVKAIEYTFSPLNNLVGMFQTIEIVKVCGQ